MIVSWIGRLSTIALSLLLVSPCWAKPEVTVNSDNTKRDTIKLRLSATDDGEPLPNLTAEDFEVISDGVLVPIKSVIPPQKNRPAPARPVILLDMSNSMLSLDSSWQTRQQGAIQAIQTILTQFKNAPLQVNIIPFGEGGGTCTSESFVPSSVSAYFKEDKFFPPNSDFLQQQLNQLAQAKLCASTNLYDPLEKTIN